jgi:hypothetical protein
MNTPSYADWKASREYDRSYDVYRRLFPEVKEYYVHRLDPNTKMSHIEGVVPFLATDDLAEAHVYIYKMFNDEGLELCIFQPRSQGYAGWYRHSNKHAKRNAAGQFAKV